MFMLQSFGTIALIFIAMLLTQAWGRHCAERDRARASTQEKLSLGAAEGAVFALLGLFLAFTFSGTGNRFEERRQLVITETNAVGTAWLRIDLLPAERQPEIRQMFRDYLDARIETYRLVAVGEPYQDTYARSMALQSRIWTASLSASQATGSPAPVALMTQALNDMFDIATTRKLVTIMHTPLVVYLMIVVLMVVSAAFVGYGLGGNPFRSFLHYLAFPLVLSAVLYVTIDLEYPRLGFVRVEAIDVGLADLRKTMD
jgi:hypothetical protein